MLIHTHVLLQSNAQTLAAQQQADHAPNKPTASLKPPQPLPERVEAALAHPRRLTVLFDLNGVLVRVRTDAERAARHKGLHPFEARPGVRHLVSLWPRCRLGLCTSATAATAAQRLKSLEELLWADPLRAVRLALYDEVYGLDDDCCCGLTRCARCDWSGSAHYTVNDRSCIHVKAGCCCTTCYQTRRVAIKSSKESADVLLGAKLVYIDHL